MADTPADLDRVLAQDLLDIAKALDCVPAQCRYHGSKLTIGERWPNNVNARPNDPCCETGASSLARRRAVEALVRLNKRLQDDANARKMRNS